MCGVEEGASPPSSPPPFDAPVQATCHASLAVQHRRREEEGEEGVERERERGTHRKSDCVCSKFWVICLLRFLDLGKDGCRIGVVSEPQTNEIKTWNRNK